MKIRPATFASALFLLAASSVAGVAQDQAPTAVAPIAGAATAAAPTAAAPGNEPAPAAQPVAGAASSPTETPATAAASPAPTTPSASAPALAATSAAPPQGAAVAAQPVAAPAAAVPQAVPTATPVAATPEPGPAGAAPAPAVPDATQQPAAVPAEHTAGPAGIDPKHLPHGLSPWGMFMAADIVVKAVMIGLAIASVMTWTVWIAKSVELSQTRGRLTSGRKAIHGAGSLAEAAQNLPRDSHLVGSLIDAAALELRLSHGIVDHAAIKERVASRLDSIVRETGRSLTYGTGVLATIGSTAPFVGLFGTVWGIMNSFIGIAESQTTNLAIVAPGIAEALLATAIGLVAAIPAVVFYNQLARAIAASKANTAEAAAEIERLVSRDLDRGLIYGAVRAAE